MAVAASYDQTLRYGAQTPFSDQLSFQWEGGMWEYDPYHSSIITAGNGGTKPTQAAFTIFYNQGTQRYDVEQTLKPDEQMWIDVGQLIREHVPDKNGKTLPPDLTMGSYEFRDLTNKGVGTLFEGKVIYDKTYGHVAYGCGTCCGYAQTVVFYAPLGVPFPGTAGQGVNSYQNCNLDWEDVSDSFWNTWTSANTSIATVNYYATHTGVATGSTTSYASAYLDGPNRPPNCPRQLKTPSGGVNVQFPVPTKVLPVATRSQGAIVCANGQGWNRIVTNQLQDQFGRAYAHSGIQMVDILTFGSTNQLGLAPETGSSTTDSNGDWADFYADCTSACPSAGQSVAQQTWTYNTLPLPHANTVIYKCTSITIDGY